MKKFLGILLALQPVWMVQAQQIKSQQPNIIFILVDDMGYGDAGIFYQELRKHNNDRSEPWMYTPNLDKMAEEGIILTSHYCAAPVCAPSRASLLSGLSQGQANVRDNQFDKALANQYTLGSLLQTAGYTTAAIGKWGLQGKGKGPDWPAHPLKRGFDYFFGYIRHKDGHEHYPKEGIYRDKAEVWENKKNIVASLDNCYTGDLWTAAAKRWIVSQSTANTKPFFLYLAYDTPHAALELPAQSYPAGSGLHGGMQWLGKPGQVITTAAGKPDSWMDPAYANATWDDDKNPQTPEVPWPETYKRYATIISRIDKQVGDLLQLLKDLGIEKNTFVVFTSDNGPSKESYLPENFVSAEPDFFNSFGPFDGIKRDVWEGGVRVPAIVRWPSHFKPATLDQQSAFNDWLPTMANLAGMPAPAFSDGHSLLPLLTKGHSDSSRSVYIEYFEGGKTPGYAEFDPSHRQRHRKQMQMLRSGDTVAVRYNIQSGNDDFEIYDIVHDPKQAVNLAKGQGMAAKQDYLKQEVLKRRRPDSSAQRPFDHMPIASTFHPAKMKQGIRYSFYEGAFDWLPAAEDLAAGKVTVLPGMASVKKKIKTNGMVFLEGYFNAPDDGLYTFFLHHAGTFLMKVYDANLFNNDQKFKSSQQMKGSIALGKGLHPFRICYFPNSESDQSIPGLTWSGPASEKENAFTSYVPL